MPSHRSSVHLLCTLLSIAGCPADDPDGKAETSSTDTPAGSSSDTGNSTTSPDASTSSSSDSTSSDASSAAIDSGLELLVCSFSGDAVGRFDLDDGSFLGNLGPSDDLDGALGIVVGPDGDIHVASEESSMVLRFGGADGAFVSRFVADDPRTLDIDESGGLCGPGGPVSTRGSDRRLPSAHGSGAQRLAPARRPCSAPVLGDPGLDLARGVRVAAAQPRERGAGLLVGQLRLALLRQALRA
jgi:hypothetical protein